MTDQHSTTLAEAMQLGRARQRAAEAVDTLRALVVDDGRPEWLALWAVLVARVQTTTPDEVVAAVTRALLAEVLVLHARHDVRPADQFTLVTS